MLSATNSLWCDLGHYCCTVLHDHLHYSEPYCAVLIVCAVFCIMPTGLVVPICVLTPVCVVSLSIYESSGKQLSIGSDHYTALPYNTQGAAVCYNRAFVQRRWRVCMAANRFGQECFQVLPFLLDRKHGKCNRESGGSVVILLSPLVSYTALLISPFTSVVVFACMCNVYQALFSPLLHN